MKTENRPAVSVIVFQSTEHCRGSVCVGCFSFSQNMLHNILLTRLEHIVYACATGGSYCDVSEDSILPGYDAVSIGKNVTNIRIKYSSLGEIYTGTGFWHRIWMLEYQSIIPFKLWN
jgi:hypothetical protein